MDAGRELDALVAEKVMGWVCICERKHQLCPVHDSYYSTDIAAAWQVVERLKHDGWNVSIGGDNGWGCTFYKVLVRGNDAFTSTWTESHGPINAENAPLAICLAALKAVGQ